MIFWYSYAIKSVYVNIFSEKCGFYSINLCSVNVKDVWFDSYDEEYFRSRQKYNNMVAMMVAMDAETSSSHAV